LGVEAQSFYKKFLERGSITLVVHKRKLSFLGTILFGLALSTFPVNAQEVSSSEQPFENQVSSVQSTSVSSVSSTVESSASSVSSSSESTSEQNTVSSGSSSASGNASSDLGGTTSSKESLQTVAPPVSDGWKTESGAVYYYKNGQKQKGWLQLNGKKYYLDSQTGVRKTKELFQTEKGFSYAQADGTILSGGKKKGDDGNLYLVSSDGILRNPGLLITPDYDGYWAPYYIDPNTHAVKTGLFSVNGTYYYGREDKGYLACGKYKAPDGKTYLANSNGTLRNPGLLITPDYDGYWAPYYIDPNTHAIKTGLFNINGTYYYGREDKGYLACGKYKAPDGKTYLANSDGTLRKSGLLITPDYDGYWAPYYIDAQTHAVKTGFFSVNGTYYYGREDKGYLVCGKYKAPDGKTYLANSNGTLRNSGLLITPDYDGYWAPYYIDAQTHAVKTGFFNVNGTYYYGREDKGYLVCGKYKAPDGKTYLANSNGTLRNPGLLITPDYDGYWAPYYIDAQTHAVKTGFFSVNGTYYYGREDKGYLACGKYKAPDGKTYLANSNGTLRNAGLLITPDYDGYWAPYYIDPNTHAVKTGLFSVNGTYYYGREDKGYLVCGKYKAPDGHFYLANSDGKLLTQTGWLETAQYDGVTERYYLENSTGNYSTVKTGFFDLDGYSYYGIPDEGHVLRGKKIISGQMFLADQDGHLQETTGWLITSEYDNGTLQRYYLNDSAVSGHPGAVIGAFTANGKKYYGREDTGYEVRGTYRAPNGTIYYADNDGVLMDVPPEIAEMEARAQEYSSNTNYLILINTSVHKVSVFYGWSGNWNRLYTWDCANGAPGTPTITGEFSTSSKGYYFDSGSARCFYYTQFYEDFLFHSTLYYQYPTPDYSMDDRVGMALSHGCVRLRLENAKWIYDNIPYGTKVVSY
jgi:glucan-binding YG repeat protein/lipoprotein-anchoring transpeptidase ErfK/SrfK